MVSLKDFLLTEEIHFRELIVYVRVHNLIIILVRRIQDKLTSQCFNMPKKAIRARRVDFVLSLTSSLTCS